MRPLSFRLPRPASLLAGLLLLVLCACSGASVRGAPLKPALETQSKGSAFIWPLSGWITAADTYWTGKAHTLGSADINTAYGQPVVAARGGTVTEAGYSVAPRLGYYLWLAHEEGYETLYAHLLNTPFVRVGQRVQLGQELGRSGRTGNAGLAHLHFAVLKDGVTLTLPEIDFGSWVNRGEPLPGLYPSSSP
jgi:murein DD-endopeptidase MepM/ murein hydrolase activator NlpD